MKKQETFQAGDIVENTGHHAGNHVYLLLKQRHTGSNWFTYYYMNNGYLYDVDAHFSPKHFALFREKKKT